MGGDADASLIGGACDVTIAVDAHDAAVGARVATERAYRSPDAGADQLALRVRSGVERKRAVVLEGRAAASLTLGARSPAVTIGARGIVEADLKVRAIDVRGAGRTRLVDPTHLVQAKQALSAVANVAPLALGSRGEPLHAARSRPLEPFRLGGLLQCSPLAQGFRVVARPRRPQ
jgi:hypothetical protein